MVTAAKSQPRPSSVESSFYASMHFTPDLKILTGTHIDRGVGRQRQTTQLAQELAKVPCAVVHGVSDQRQAGSSDGNPDQLVREAVQGGVCFLGA